MKYYQQAIQAIIKQGEPSSSDGQCYYRVSKEGKELKCVVGHLIKDEHYNKELEGKSVTASSVLLALEESLGVTLDSKEDIGYLTRIQSAHDTSSAFDDFASSFIARIQRLMDEGHLPSDSLEEPPKATVRRPATTLRQFDVTFKKTVVRNVQELRRQGKHGSLTAYYKALGITRQHAAYWEKQFQQGHFSSERAVAFSRKEVMIHG